MKAGRHRAFDKDIALDKAVEVFWTNGYPGTSLSDLTNAMGINKPSLYSAFGNKEELFKNALERYVQKYGLIHSKHLFSADKSLSERIQSYLKSIADMVTDPNLPGGCLICISTGEVAGTCLPTGALQTIIKINEVTKSTFVKFFNVEKEKGNISRERSPLIMANYLLTLQFGLAVMARNGAGLKELNDVIKYSVSKF